MKKIITTIAILTVILTASCKKEVTEPGGSIGQTKTITWETFHEFEANEHVHSFAISDDAKYLFYAEQRKITRVDMTNGETKVLFNEPSAIGLPHVHFIKGKLYMTYDYTNKAYFAISDDFGETVTEHLTGTYTNVAAGFYYGAFVRLVVNRLFIMPNGDLVIPYVHWQPSELTIKGGADPRRIAISTDGGATWELKVTEVSYITAQQNNRLFSKGQGWEGDFGIGASGASSHSDDLGDTWHKSELKYMPQAIDREGNLISCSLKECRKLKNGTWTLYQWEGIWPTASGVQNFNLQGNIHQYHDDIEFDSANNLYLLNSNGIYKTKLN